MDVPFFNWWWFSFSVLVFLSATEYRHEKSISCGGGEADYDPLQLARISRSCFFSTLKLLSAMDLLKEISQIKPDLEDRFALSNRLSNFYLFFN